MEDDDNIAELISATLTASSYRTEVFGSAAQLESGLEKALPDLILLDVMLPEKSGYEIIRQLKEQPATQKIPVIFLTAKTTELDKVIGLELGAEDYITKPFGVLELQARVKTALRRAAPSQQRVVASDLVIDFDSREVYQGGNRVRLTFKEFELLEYLYKNAGIVLSRDKILSNVWGYDFEGDTTRTVDMHVRTLRQKLSDSADHPRYIETVRGYGYKFMDSGDGGQ